MMPLISDLTPIGYRALVELYQLKTMPHYRWSYVAKKGERRSIKQDGFETHIYPRGYQPKNAQDPLEHLEFALKHEGLNLEILKGFFKVVDADFLTKWILQQPLGKYSRIVWYLYEYLLNKTLLIPDLTKGPYVDLLDAQEYYTCNPIQSRRHRVNNNLLGNQNFCPFIRKTSDLLDFEKKRLDEACAKAVERYGQSVIARAMQYLYTKETMSSYEIERERPDKKRLAQFTDVLKKADRLVTLNQEVLAELQSTIVESRFAQSSYRTNQNYVAEQHYAYPEQQIIHYISPKPEDVEVLMNGLLAALDRMMNSNIHAVVIAAAVSFGFVFIHPFEDGNGRIHRFLIHHILAKTKFAPQGIIFPVSAVMLKRRKEYDEVLESFSRSLLTCISHYHINDEGVLLVQEETQALYQYSDYTIMATFLFKCIEETIVSDFKKELEYIINYDKTKQAIQEIVDMPDRLINLFIGCVLQNNGTLSTHKRTKFFSMLTDDEVLRIQKIIQTVLLPSA